jgi:hypothetical protein
MAGDSFYRSVAAEDSDDESRPPPPPPPQQKPKVTLIPVAPPKKPNPGFAGFFQRCKADAEARRGGGRIDLTKPAGGLVDLTIPRVEPTNPNRKPAAIFQQGYRPPPAPKKGKAGKVREELRECVVRNGTTGQFEYVDRDGKRTPCDN